MLAAGGNETEERRRLVDARHQAVRAQVKFATALQTIIRETGRVRLEAEVKRLACEPLQRVVDEKTELIRTLQGEMSALKADMTLAERELNDAKVVVLEELKKAKAASGFEPGTRDQPPKALKEYWEQVMIDSFESC